MSAPRQQLRRFGATDPNRWLGAAVVMLALTALLWAIQAVNSAHRLTEYGLEPRDATGLRGIVFQPFLHGSWGHLEANTVPFLLIGWLVLLGGLRTWAIVTAAVVLGGGLLTWLVAPGNTVIVGASGLVFGWLGYLLARAVISRDARSIAVGVIVALLFGTLLFGVLPSAPGVSWQAHACGLVAGVAIAAALPRQRAVR